MIEGDVCFLMIRRPPRSTQSGSSAASDVYKRLGLELPVVSLVSLNPTWKQAHSEKESQNLRRNRLEFG